MRAILLLIIVLGSIPIIFLKPHVGILVWSWLSYMNPHRLTWGFTQDFGFAQIIGLITIGSWLISKEPKKFPLTTITAFMIAFTLWVSWTTVFALAQADAIEKWKLVMKILLVTYLTIPLFQSRKRIVALIWVITLSIGFYGAKGGFFVLLTNGQYLVFGPPDSFIAANNSIALALIMILPLMRYLQLQSDKLWQQLGWLAFMGLTSLAILSSYSRGAFLAVIAMFAVMWLKSPKKLMIGVVGVAGLATAIAFMPDKWVQRIETIQTYEQDGSAMGRLTMWRFGYSVALARPFFGGGFGIFPSSEYYDRFGLSICKENTEAAELDITCTTDARSSHSVYFEVLGEHGFVGLALFLFIGIATFITGNWIIRMTRGNPNLAWAKDLAAMLQVSLVGYATNGLFLNKAYFDLYYHLVAIMVVVHLVVRREISTDKAQALKQIPSGLEGAPIATGATGR